MMPKNKYYYNVILAVLSLLLLSTASCSNAISEEDLLRLSTPRVEVYFNSPGTREGTQRNRAPSEILVERIDAARVSLDLAVYGFNKQNIIDAIIRAHKRGVRVRGVGDAKSFGYGASGFVQLEKYQIPMQVGNQFHIMHNKFFIIDGRFVFTGTGNISNSEFVRNNNNWTMIDSVPVAETFTDEFEQMFAGRFSAAKRSNGNPNSFQVGDTRVEVFFSPQEDGMGKILEELEKVHTSIHFTIFAFTKDQIASIFINKHREFEAHNESLGLTGLPVMQRPKRVTGILDRSQLHGNGQYHQSYRMMANGLPLRMDANENSAQIGDYQAGGGRLHAKTMILDAGTPDARIISGSFNWSSAATISNDEVLLVLHGERLVNRYMEEFGILWEQSKDVTQAMCNYMKRTTYDGKPLLCANQIQPGDVVLSEIHWDGWNGQRDPSHHTGRIEFRRQQSNDEFVELYNNTDYPIDLSMWTLHNGHDIIMGFTPGTVILPGQYFLVLDHNTVPLSERDPQHGSHAFLNPDFVLNMANDPRFRRLNLKDGYMNMQLRDSKGRAIDTAGDGGPPFFGGRQGDFNYSMERIIPASGPIPDGRLRSSWQECSLDEGGANVAAGFRSFIIATPGEPNSVYDDDDVVEVDVNVEF